LLIGLDFDNTLVCYNEAIVRLADKLLKLPPDLPRTKLAIRDYLREANREHDWTAFQGELYGPGMSYAEPFEHSVETLQVLKAAGYSLCIVSHRSFTPYAGPAYDLHAAARAWIDENLALDLIVNSQAFFYETMNQKIAAIGALECEIFVDDLPIVLANEDFPSTCQPILFDPENFHAKVNFVRINHWNQLPMML